MIKMDQIVTIISKTCEQSKVNHGEGWTITLQ